MLLATESLTVKFKNRTALDEVCLSFTGDGATAILGVNGAGKTTLMRTLATTLSPSSGDVTINNVSTRSTTGRHEARRLLGYMPQGIAFPRRITCHDVVEYAAWLMKVPSRDRRDHVTRALEKVQLAPRAADRVGTLSGGMQRRLALAAALVHKPIILLLDEPTAGMDPRQRLNFERLVNDLASETAVIISTHIAEDVEKSASRVVVLDGGRVRFEGAYERFLGHDLTNDKAPTVAGAFESIVSESEQ